MADNDTQARGRFGAGVVSELDRLCDELSGPNRRMRQEAAHELAERLRNDPDSLGDEAGKVIEALADALFRPEAQTRWEALDSLSELVAGHADEVAEAYDGAEASLFDEGSSTVRIAAFRLIARLAATSPERSDKAWPLLDEAIQCFHGDTGYRDMLAALLELARGDASAATKEALASRMDFDATSGHGYVRVRSAEIVAATKGE